MGAVLPIQSLYAANLDQGEVGQPNPEDVNIGVLLGDSVVHGFGHSPVLYNETLDFYREDRYKFKPNVDAPVESLAGFKGIQIWLNRGVTGNSSKAALERWRRDVVERADRGVQKKNYRTDWVLVSVGMTDIGAAVGTPRLLQAESKLRQNILTLVRYAREERIHITFLELPDPLQSPLGRSFTNAEGQQVLNFCESHEYTDKDCTDFTDSVLRVRKFMERYVPPAGGTVIDYAQLLPTEYFLDSFHPSKVGYEELGRILRERYPGPL